MIPDAVVTMSYADMAATVWLFAITIAFLGVRWVLGRCTWGACLTYVGVGCVVAGFLMTASPAQAPVEQLPAGVEAGP